MHYSCQVCMQTWKVHLMLHKYKSYSRITIARLYLIDLKWDSIKKKFWHIEKKFFGFDLKIEKYIFCGFLNFCSIFKIMIFLYKYSF